MKEDNLTESVVGKMLLQETAGDFIAYICLSRTFFSAQYLETFNFLHPVELKYYSTLKYERRIKSFLAGRYAAKKAISFFICEENLDHILIEKGIFNQPIVVYPNKTNIQVSISHCDNYGVAVAFSEKLPMGIDIEKISTNSIKMFNRIMSDREKDLSRLSTYPNQVIFTIFWTAKEALSKILKTGLTTPFYIYEINQIKTINGVVFSSFKNFVQYCTVSFLFNGYVCSITYPKSTILNIEALKDIFKDAKD